MENDQKLLADKDRQIAEYRQHVAKQAAKLAALSAKGSQPEDAVDLLKQFKEASHYRAATRVPISQDAWRSQLSAKLAYHAMRAFPPSHGVRGNVPLGRRCRRMGLPTLGS
jgi:hypothetical protein